MRDLEKHEDGARAVGILHQLARTGGTIINRCLGCMQNTIMFSELHPDYMEQANFSPIHQARQWFDLISAEEQATLGTHALRDGASGFLRSVELIEERTRRSRRHLLIREWSHADFIRTPNTNPVFRSRMAELLGGTFDVKRAAIVRHPLDQWRSMQDYSPSRGRFTLADYLRGHRLFAEMAVEVGFIRYEDFCHEPADTLQRVCRGLGVPFDPTFRERWVHYDRVTGDASRPPALPIRARERAPANDRLMEDVLRSEDYRTSLALLGYTN